MSDKSISPELLDRYLAGQCTAEEVSKVENWYAEQGGEEDILASMPDLDRQLLEEDTLKKIKNKIGIAF